MKFIYIIFIILFYENGFKEMRSVSFESFMKAIIPVVISAAVLGMAYIYAGITGDSSLINEAESAFNLKAVGLAFGAVGFIGVMVAIAIQFKSKDGKHSQRGIGLFVDVVDDFGGVCGSVGGIALLMGFDKKNIKIAGIGLCFLPFD